MSTHHQVSPIFTGAVSSSSDPVGMAEDKIAHLEKQLQKAWDDYFAATSKKHSEITVDAVRAIQEKYPFLVSMDVSSSGGLAEMRLENMPMRFANTGNSEDNLNEDVVFVTGPEFRYTVQCNPRSIQFKNLTGMDRADPDFDNILHSTIHDFLEGANFDTEELGDKAQYFKIIKDPRDTSSQSHPHSSENRSTFSDICYGTNTFHPRYGGPEINDGGSFSTFTLGMLQWITTGNNRDMYNKRPVPRLDLENYYPGLISDADVTAASEFLAAAKIVVRDILYPSIVQKQTAYDALPDMSDSTRRVYEAALTKFLDHFRGQEFMPQPNRCNPAAVLVASVTRHMGNGFMFRARRPSALFLMLNAAYFVLYMKALSLSETNSAYRGKSSMELSLYYSVYSLMTRPYESFLRNPSWYPPGFIQQWYESPAMFSKAVRDQIHGRSDSLSPATHHVLNAMAYTQPGTLFD